MSRHKKSHISDPEVDAVLEYATSVIKTLGMAQWVVIVMDEPCDDDAYASVKWTEGRYVAKVYLSETWSELSDDIRRNTITHEILHLVHSRVSDAVDEAEDFMHDYEFRAFQRRYRRETELMVDHLATFMADTHTLTEAWEAAHCPVTPEQESA